MGTADKIRELIDQTATIKANFYLGNSLSFSSYDWRKREKKIKYMQVEKINDNPEFMRWRDEIVLSLSQLKKDDYIDEVIKLLKKFDGLTDKTKFEQVESKLSVLKEHIDEYIINSNNITISDERVQEKELLNKVLKAVSKLQKNHSYNLQSSENEMNDYIRDILDVLYSDYSEVIVVGAGADAVDYKLISICHKGDIVVSQDYGVAAMALGKGAYAIHQSGKWYTNENIDMMLMERHLNKKARRGSNKNHIKGPKKRTEEDDVRFAQSFEKLILMAKSKEGAQSGTI